MRSVKDTSHTEGFLMTFFSFLSFNVLVCWVHCEDFDPFPDVEVHGANLLHFNVLVTMKNLTES